MPAQNPHPEHNQEGDTSARFPLSVHTTRCMDAYSKGYCDTGKLVLECLLFAKFPEDQIWKAEVRLMFDPYIIVSAPIRKLQVTKSSLGPRKPAASASHHHNSCTRNLRNLYHVNMKHVSWPVSSLFLAHGNSLERGTLSALEKSFQTYLPKLQATNGTLLCSQYLKNFQATTLPPPSLPQRQCSCTIRWQPYAPKV